MSEDTPQQSNPDDAAETADAASDSVPMNRAERRAKGKKSAQQVQQPGKPHFTPKNTSAGGPRIWANRKAG
jgi:hypothetical protein